MNGQNGLKFQESINNNYYNAKLVLIALNSCCLWMQYIFNMIEWLRITMSAICNNAEQFYLFLWLVKNSLWLFSQVEKEWQSDEKTTHQMKLISMRTFLLMNEWKKYYAFWEKVIKFRFLSLSNGNYAAMMHCILEENRHQVVLTKNQWRITHSGASLIWLIGNIKFQIFNNTSDWRQDFFYFGF